MLRRVCLVEAVSYLLLCFVAMPIKYVDALGRNGMPVRILGMAHGVLFLLMIWFLIRARIEEKWPMPRLRKILIASLVWFWPFFLDRQMREWIEQSRQQGQPQG